MKRATLLERKRFAAELAERDLTGERSVAQSRTPTANMLLLARACVARRLVRDGVLEPGVALAYAVWPTAAIREQEQQVGYGTLTGRAFGKRCNP